jgi:hypothetical protein
MVTYAQARTAPELAAPGPKPPRARGSPGGASTGAERPFVPKERRDRHVFESKT